MTPEDVRAELERILAAEAFVNAGRLSRLLRYLVERTLAGDGDHLKEYVLGVEVFDRNDSYDPRLDSIVRVEARRLRAKLEEYYRGPGTTDPVVITIPRGNYTPIFSAAAALSRALEAPSTPHAAPAHGTEHSAPAPRIQHPGLGTQYPTPRTPLAIAIAIAIATLLILILFTTPGSRPDVGPSAQASAKPSIAVLPFQPFSTDEAHAMLAAQITDGVTTNLARLGTVAVASRTSASQYTDAVRPLPEIAAALGVDFVMEASAVTQDLGGVRVEARVVDGTSDRKVWVGQYDSRPDRIPELTRQIASEASAAIQKISNR